MAHRFLCQVQESGSVRGVVHVYIPAHMRSCAHASRHNCEEFIIIYTWVIPSCDQVHPTEGTERRFALRLTLPDSNCQCAVVLYHELVLRAAADMDAALPEGVQGTQPVRAQLRDLFRAAQWLCRFTFRQNDYQQTLELECRHDALSACQPS